MNNEPNKPIEAEELTDKELEGIVGGTTVVQDVLATELDKVQSTLQELPRTQVRTQAGWNLQMILGS